MRNAIQASFAGKRAPLLCLAGGGASLICSCVGAGAQQSNTLECRGVLGDTPAVLSGVRQSSAPNALGDSYIQFGGVVTAGGAQGQIAYGGTRASAR